MATTSRGLRIGTSPNSGDLNCLGADELGLETRLAILEEQGNNLSKMLLELVERFSLRMGARPTGNMADVYTRIGVPFDDRCIGAHRFLCERGCLLEYNVQRTWPAAA